MAKIIKQHIKTPKLTVNSTYNQTSMPFGVDILMCENVTVKSNSTAALALTEQFRSLHPYVLNLACRFSLW